MDVIIGIEIDNHSLAELGEWVVESEGKCFDCKTPYKVTDVKSYDHEGAYTITGFEKKQWVYIECNKCKIDMKIAVVIQKILLELQKCE